VLLNTEMAAKWEKVLESTKEHSVDRKCGERGIALYGQIKPVSAAAQRDTAPSSRRAHLPRMADVRKSDII
jgi:hypothetical protein